LLAGDYRQALAGWGEACDFAAYRTSAYHLLVGSQKLDYSISDKKVAQTRMSIFIDENLRHD